METIKYSHLDKQIEKKSAERTATTRKTVFARLKERFGHALKDDAGQIKTSTAKIVAGVALAIVTTVGSVSCGSDVAEPSPTEDAGGKSDANGVHEKDGGKDAGKDVGQEDRENPGDVEVPDGGTDASKDAENDGETDGPVSTDGGDQEIKDGGDFDGDGGPTDTCDNVAHKENFTDEKESKQVTRLDGENVTVNYYYTGEQENLCGEIKNRKVDKLTVEFDPPQTDTASDLIATHGVEFEILGQKLEIQEVGGLTPLIAITKRVFWERNGPFSPEFSGPFVVDGQPFRCIGITDTTANFYLFAGGLSYGLAAMKAGDYGCRDPPTEPDLCGKLYVVDKQRNNGDGYIAGITSDNRGVGFKKGVALLTKTLFWQTKENQPVLFDNSKWITTSLDMSATNNSGIVTVTLTGFTIERQY